MSKKEAIEKLLEKVSANLWDYTSPNVAITNKHIVDSKKLIDQAIALSKPEPLRNQPCGCILCDCDSEGRCLGCGSKMCGKHQDIGHLPKNEMAYHKAEQSPVNKYSDSEFTKMQCLVIELLEKNVVFYDNVGSGPIAQIPRDNYDQVLALFKEQPLASEFTKECREVVIEGQCGKDIKEAVEPEVMVEVDNDGKIIPVNGNRDKDNERFVGIPCDILNADKPKRGKNIKRFTDLSSASEFTKEIREYLSLVCKRTSEDTSWEQLEDIITEITKKLCKACKIIDASEANRKELVVKINELMKFIREWNDIEAAIEKVQPKKVEDKEDEQNS